MIAAGIDVGTNSIKLLIARLGRPLRTIEEHVEITRLGEGLSETGVISDGAMRRSLRVLARYRERCDRRRCGAIVAAGTEALRKALNTATFLGTVRGMLGLDVRVIDGEEEGRLSRLGGIADWPDAATIEIGGGSAQISNGRSTVSLPIGAVTMTERYLGSDPPTERELDAARLAMREALRKIRFRAEGRVVSLGGTAASIGTMWTKGNFKRVHGLKIPLAKLDAFVAEIAAETTEDRKRRKGLDPARADIIVAGGIILSESMRRLGASAITLSVSGLRHGLLMDYLASTSERR